MLIIIDFVLLKCFYIKVNPVVRSDQFRACGFFLSVGGSAGAGGTEADRPQRVTCLLFNRKGKKRRVQTCNHGSQ